MLGPERRFAGDLVAELQEKQLLKYSPEHFFVAGMDKYFPTSFWWSLSVLLPYWEEIYSLNWGPPL